MNSHSDRDRNPSRSRHVNGGPARHHPEVPRRGWPLVRRPALVLDVPVGVVLVACWLLVSIAWAHIRHGAAADRLDRGPPADLAGGHGISHPPDRFRAGSGARHGHGRQRAAPLGRGAATVRRARDVELPAALGAGSAPVGRPPPAARPAARQEGVGDRGQDEVVVLATRRTPSRVSVAASVIAHAAIHAAVVPACWLISPNSSGPTAAPA